MASPSHQDFYDLGYYEAQRVRPTLVVYEGDVSDSMLTAAATMASAVVAEGARDVRSTFLDGADGPQLTAEAHDRGVDRDPAVPAIGSVRVTNTSIPLAGTTLPVGFRFATPPDTNGAFQSFKLTEQMIWDGVSATAEANAEAITAGSDGNVDEDTVTVALDQLATYGIASGATITNVEAFTGGDNEQSDEDLREETRGFFQTQRRGTEDALIFSAKQVPQVRRASVVLDESGIVLLYVSDANGNANAAMVDAVVAVINGPPAWRSAGDVVQVIGADLFLVSIDITLTMRAGVAAAPFFERIRTAIVGALKRLQPGETFYRDIVKDAVRSVDPQRLYIANAIMNNPTTEIEPSADQVIRALPEGITFS